MDRVKGKQLQIYIISLLELHVKHLFIQRFGFLWEDSEENWIISQCWKHLGLAQGAVFY